MTTNNEKIRILGKGITALALKDKFPNATLYDDNDFNQYDLNSNEYTVVSPGIPPYNNMVLNSKNLISDYDLFASSIPFSIWISGTNGKTTTTQMCQHLLKEYGSIYGGNIGVPLSHLDEKAPIWILETSSFTLHYTNKAKPNIYILLPISEDHITWHGSFEEYKNAKLKPLSLMNENDIAIIPAEFKDFKTKCGEQYGIAIEFRNQQIYRTQGYVQFKVNYVVEGVCCDGCSTGCESGDDNLVAKKLVDAINNDPRGFVKAEMFNTTTNAVVTDYDAFVAANLVVNTDANLTNDVKLGVRITSIPQKINKYMGIDTKYFHMRETFLVPSKLIGFECNGEFSVKQTAKVTQGLGYDIQYLEYLAGGWNGNPGPYRTYKVNGLAKPITYVAETNTQYGILALTYDQFSIGGWLEYLNNEASIIAIPQADSVTRASLLGVIDKLAKLSNFDGLADDAAGYNVATPETDGLGDSTAATRP